MSNMINKNLKRKDETCKDCGVKVDEYNGKRVGGYLIRQCIDCRRKFHRELNKKKKDKMKLFKEWYG